MTAPPPLPSDADLLHALTTCERQVWEALVRGDQSADAALLCDSFLGVYADGFANKADHTGQLQQGPTVQTYQLDQMQARPLGLEHALLSYRATVLRVGRDTSDVMFVSSIWQRHGPDWRNIFSQDTSGLPAG